MDLVFVIYTHERFAERQLYKMVWMLKMLHNILLQIRICYTNTV